MTILISNVFSDENIGGAAITAATIRAVKQAFPHEVVKLIAINNGPSFEKSHPYTIQAFPEAEIVPPLIRVKPGPLQGLRTVLRSLRVLRTLHVDEDAVRSLGDARAVISKGGYVYRERTTMRSLMSLWITAFPIVLGNALGKQTAVVCTTIGPFESAPSRRLNRYLLSRVDLVVPRDELSYRAALDLGLDPQRVVYLPDVVFSYPCPSETQAEFMAERVGVARQRYAILTLSKAADQCDADFQLHTEQMIFALRTLLERKVLHRVLCTVHAPEDLHVSRDFVRKMDDDRACLIEPRYSPDELMALYMGAQVLVARRMHSAIFSLVAGTPVLVFTMSGQKVQGVIRSLRLGDMIMDFPLKDADRLVERIERYVQHRRAERERVAEAVETARKQIRELPSTLRSYLTPPS